MAFMGDLLGGASGGVSGMFAGFKSVGSSIGIFVLVAILVGIITYFIVKKKNYTKSIHIFEEINQTTVNTGNDKAREVALGGMIVFYLKKRKLYIPRPTKQSGKGHYLYFITRDGEWINFQFENLNKTRVELELGFDHTDMRYANSSLKKLVEKNYKKMNWIKEFAPYIAIGILVLLLGVAFMLVANQINKGLGGLAQVSADNREMLRTSVDLLRSVDNICSSSGIAPAPTPLPT